jgi:outer membrane autotransporter protein
MRAQSFMNSSALALGSAKGLSSLLFVAGLSVASPAAAQVSDSCITLPGGIVSCTDATAILDSATTVVPGPGLVANSATDLILNVTGNITTVDDGEVAVLLRAVDEVIFTSDGIITTFGDNADGVNIEGSTVTADLNVVRTFGNFSDAVEILATEGGIRLNADLLETNGDLARGTVLRGTGDIDLGARAIRTQGTDAVAIDIQSDAAACILLGMGGCDVTVAAEEVTTEGFGGIGALIAAAGDTNVNIGVLRTGGDEAAGLDLSADAAACIILGVGACDTAFTIGELTTEGGRSPGALVRAVGDIDANVGVLRTQGDEAIGLDLASDPEACLILGAGACDTSFTVGELTTSGAGATGVLVRAAGQTTGNVGVLRTEGDDAVGIDIAADPVVCVLLGAGACDVGLTANEVSTQGDGAAAVIINTVGNVTTDLGLITTDGDDSAGLQIAVDPALCLVLGPGTCVINAAVDDVQTGGDNSPGIEVDGGEDPITVEAGNVETEGDNSPGIDVEGTGPITVVADNVATAGDNSPGIVVVGDDDPVAVTCGTIHTRGNNSPGVDITAEGDIDVRCVAITTEGDNSEGVIIDGGDGTVLVDVRTINTAGPNSDGVNIVTDDGDQVIVVGGVNVTGAGSDAINAVSDCGDIFITAQGPISSADGTAIYANTGCRVTVTTLEGAPVTGRVAGIDVTSGLGSTITIGDLVASSEGPAVNVDGAGTVLTIAPTGTVRGRIDLTDNNDVFINNGLFVPVGTSNFGLGNDVVTNNGTIQVAGAPVLAGCESFTNAGLITMVNGTATDRLTLCGNYTGATGSRLAIDVQADQTGTPTDQLFIGGNAGGSTSVTLNLLGGPGVINTNGALVVDAATATGNPFTLAGPVRSGFVDYALVQRSSDTFLVALPNAFAIEPLVLTGMGLDFWYQSADAWSESAAIRRSNLGSDRPRGISYWMQGYASDETRGEEDRTFDVFGTAREANLRYETDRRGAQGGVDFATGRAMAFGLTGGYQRAKSDLASGTGVALEGYNIGAYMLFGGASGLYAELLAKADFFDARIVNGNLFGMGEVDGQSYGAEGEVGYRMPFGGLNVDLGAGLAYVRTSLDAFEASNFRFDLDRGESLRGRAGVRIAGTGSIAPYLDLKVFHEFMDGNALTVESGGYSLAFDDSRKGTWFRGELGLTGAPGESGGFVSAWIERGEVKGYGLRLGFRF